MIIKVCGMREAQNIQAVEQLGIDWMGFIFYPKSSRYVSDKPAYLPTKTKRVGVFVNATTDEIKDKAVSFGLDIAQLHGQEPPADCALLHSTTDLTVIKAFGIKDEHDFAKVGQYEGTCDYYLFDTKTPLMGGAGYSFDWSLLNHYVGNTPFLLSGGINPNSAEAIRALQHPQFVGIDLNSKFEISPALKDVDTLNRFIQTIRNNE